MKSSSPDLSGNDHLGYTESEYKIYKKNSNLVLIMFSLLYCMLYCGRLNLSPALDPMETELGWSKMELGILSSVLFWTYGFGHLINGRLGEIFGIKKFIIIGAILSGVANIFIGFQSVFLVIAVLWGLNGYFQSMLWSPGIALISAWWPGNKRGFATGFANAFSGFGQAVAWAAVYLSFSLFPQFGWKSAFFFPVIPIFVMVIIFGLVVKNKPTDAGISEYKEDAARAEHEDELKKVVEEKGKLYPYIHLFKQWRFDCWCLLIACSNVARYGLLTWIPMYFAQNLGVTVDGGLVGTVALPVGMGLGTLIVPWVTDKVCPNNRLPAVLICSLVAAGTVFIFPRLTSMALIAVMLFIAGFFIYAINGCVWAYASDIGGRVFGGTATGILDWAAYMGSAIQALYFGYVLDSTENWTFVFLCITVVCILIAVLAIIAGRGQNTKTPKINE